MTDDEYREYLVALARKHLKPGQLYNLRPAGGAVEQLAQDIERLSSTNRLLRVVRERSDNPMLLNELSQDLRRLHETGVADDVVTAMDKTGILDALDEAPEIFEHLRRSAIPPDDIQLLSRAGVEDPEAEISILLRRRRYFYPYEFPSQVAHAVPDELLQAAKRVEQINKPEPQPERKKRKLFNGIGKLLSGTITGAGNILLAAGTFVAPNPATAYLAMGSSAVAILYMGQGIGDLRGE